MKIFRLLCALFCLSAVQLSFAANFPVPNAKITGTSTVAGTFTFQTGSTLDVSGATLTGFPSLSDRIAALNALSTSANKLPYFTGAETFGLVDFSAFSQSLLPLTTSSAYRDLLFPSSPAAGDYVYHNGTAWVKTSLGAQTGMAKLTAGVFTAGVAGTDYVVPGSLAGSGLTISSGFLVGRTTASTGATEAVAVSSDFTLDSLLLALSDSGATAGTYGSASLIPVIAVDAKGRVTGISTVSVSTGFTNPMTTAGDLIVGGSSGAATRLGIGSNGQVLKIASGSVGWGTDSGSSPSVVTVTWASSTAIDFANFDPAQQTVTLAGNTTFTTSNLAAGRQANLRIVCDSTGRTFTWPGSWVWIGGTAPASIAASKTALLSLISYSTTDSAVVAAYAVEP